jgi:hypothetical protein
LSSLLEAEGVILEPLFGLSEERILDRTASFGAVVDEEAPAFETFYQVQAEDEKLDELAERLLEQETVEAAYVKPASEPPVAADEQTEVLNAMLPSQGEPPIHTPDFTSRQGYLDPAPGGIDARYAWTVPGGRGGGVRIIDCEWGWRFTHEDLTQLQMGVVVGTSSSNDNHGTAVIGELSGDRNTLGITGICPDAIVGAGSFVSRASARTIREAADRLRPGDILILEIHRGGPNATGAGQFGYIAIEWWPDDFAAIRYAVSRGILVFEAAGNGRQNLDDPVYNTRPAGFPTSWRNPFNPANPSSGAIVVGAGAPPPGTHGRNHGPDRSRLGFSNYGARVDAQGWGREVTSTGYGDLQGGSNRDEWYTDTFSGTSSATPIVAGALGCVQGILRRRGSTPLTPARTIDLLRATGSPQQDEPSRPRTQRIGNRPDLRRLIPAAVPAWKWHGWENLGGLCTDGVGVSSWAANRRDCFVAGNDKAMWHKWWNGSSWSSWESLGGRIYSAPAAVSWGPNRIDAFAIGGDRAMWHKWWNGSSWRGWENLGGFCTDGVGVSSWAANRLDCFVVGNNRRLYHKWWNGTSWSGWEDLGGQCYSAPAAVSWGPNRIDVFVIGGNRSMWHKWWNGSSWSGWENLGGCCTGGVGVSSWAANRLDCFVVGNDRAMWHKWWNGSSWRGWENLGGRIYSAPAAVSWGPNRIDTFAIGGNRAMWHKWYT